jgi:aerobic-type carbon monoxide dehydrogenase small subunit (CoxS/CutS family)
LAAALATAVLARWKWTVWPPAPASRQFLPSKAKIFAPSKAGQTTIVKALQAAWVTHQVPQCGYCQSGMILAAASLLRVTPKPTDADIDASITNICRCGTYQRIRAAIHTAARWNQAVKA